MFLDQFFWELRGRELINNHCSHDHDGLVCEIFSFGRFSDVEVHDW